MLVYEVGKGNQVGCTISGPFSQKKKRILISKKKRQKDIPRARDLSRALFVAVGCYGSIICIKYINFSRINIKKKEKHTRGPEMCLRSVSSLSGATLVAIDVCEAI